MVHPIRSHSSAVMLAVHSRTEEYVHALTSNKSQIRSIQHVDDEDELLAQIGYKQELNRNYSTLQVFGIAFSIMGLLPSIASTMATGYEAGPVGLVWGWIVSSFFILCVGTSMSVLASLLPTSGGLYYWTNYYAPDSIRVPLSFVVGCSNTLALCGGCCSINSGFATEILSAVFISKDGNFSITDAKNYGVFAGCTVSHVFLCCIASRQTAWLQAFSIYANVFLIVLFFIAVPVGASKHGFNDAHFIFGELQNNLTWSQGWSFMLAWMPAIWTIGAFDSCVHMSEEAKSKKSIPVGIIGSILVCGLLGWFICICATACIKNGDVAAVMDSSTGLTMAQIIYDALGKEWAVAFMALIAVAQYLMGASILIAASRQIWAFSRDDGLPFFHNIVKVVNPRIKVPVRATIFGGCLSLIIGLLILVGPTAAGALFSLAVAGNTFAWGMPVFLVLLPTGRKRFVPGPFHFGNTLTTLIHCITVAWTSYVIVMSMFPSSKSVDKESMNYASVINVGVWILSLVYYYVYGYRVYNGPKSNLDEGSILTGQEVHNIDQTLEEKA